MMTYQDKTFSNIGFTDDSTFRADERFSYIRPYDMVFLMGAMHLRIFSRNSVINANNSIETFPQSEIIRSQATAEAGNYADILRDHSYWTMKNPNDKLAAHLLHGIAVEVSSAVAQELSSVALSCYIKSFNPNISDEKREEKEAKLKYAANLLTRMVMMGSTPSSIYLLTNFASRAPSLIKPLAKLCKIEDTEAVQNLYKAAQYFSEIMENIPKPVRDGLYYATLTFAASYNQFSDVGQNYLHNYFAILPITSQPYESINKTDAFTIAIAASALAFAYVLTSKTLSKTKTNNFAEENLVSQQEAQSENDIEMQVPTQKVRTISESMPLKFHTRTNKENVKIFESIAEDSDEDKSSEDKNSEKDKEEEIDLEDVAVLPTKIKPTTKSPKAQKLNYPQNNNRVK